jgi:DNA-binding MarR family transcriptional regulator
MSEPASDLNRLIPDVMRAFRRVLFDRMRTHDLPIVQAVVLMRLGSQGPCNAKTIAQFMGITPGSVTSLMDRLERKGLVRRTTNEHDRRSTIFSLTDEALRLQESMKRMQEEQLLDLCQRLGRSRTLLLRDLLRDMRSALADME